MEELLLHRHLPKLSPPFKATPICPYIRRRRHCIDIFSATAATIQTQTIPLSKKPIPTTTTTLPILPSTRIPTDTTAILLSAGITPTSLARAVGVCPELHSFPSSAIAAAINFLISEAGVSAADLPRLLHRRPRLLVSSVPSRLKPTMYFLKSIGFRPADISDHADVLAFSVEDKLLPRIELLESSGLSRRKVHSMVRRFPALFYYSVENNLRPKAEFLVGVMERGIEEVFAFPDYFSYRFEGRIVPRHEACVEVGLRLPLSAMLRPGERKFRAILEVFAGSKPPGMQSPLWSARNWEDLESGEGEEKVMLDGGSIE